MIEGLRRRLGLKRSERVYVPQGQPPSLMLRREGDQWGVAVLHGDRELAWLTPKQARQQSMRFLEMAWLAANPGSCPNGILE
jgi:hypothetical protein